MTSDRNGKRSPQRRPKARDRFFRPLVEALELRTLLTLTPELVGDFNSVPTGVSAPLFLNHVPMCEVGGVLYFSGNDKATGDELWRSDGTSQGTYLLKDIYPGSHSSNINGLANIAGTLFFYATDGVHGYDLWKSDGTSNGTVIFADNPHLGMPVNVSGVLFFAGSDPVHGSELWKSDGTAAGTTLVKDVFPGRTYYPSGRSVLNNSSPSNLTNVNGTLFFTATDSQGEEIWKSDGTPGGTVIANQINLGDIKNYPPSMAVVNSTLFAAVHQGPYDAELWKQDATDNDAVQLAAISTNGTHPTQLTNANGRLFFAAGTQLWTSDGTTTGTTLVANAGYPQWLKAVGNDVYFFGGPSGQRGLWKSDGTSVGTVQLLPSPGSVSYTWDLTNINGTLFFAASTPQSTGTLWKSDGTVAGTTMVSSLLPEHGFSSGFSPFRLTNVNGDVFFFASDGSDKDILWRSDGTTSGTVPVIPNTGQTADFLQPNQPKATIGDIMYFTASDGVHGLELWKTDGTPAGTLLVKDILPGPSGSGPAFLTNVSGTLFFSAYDAAGHNLLWKSDGSADGTVSVKELVGSALGLTNVNGTLLFDISASAQSGASGIWKSDGTADGTVKVSDAFMSGSVGSQASAGNLLFFHGPYGDLWRSDGTTAGTFSLNVYYDDVLVPLGQDMYFVGGVSLANRQLWRTDGTLSGTVLVKAFTSPYVDLESANGQLFLMLDTGQVAALWKSDGTSAGTELVKSGLTHRNDSFPWIANVNGRLFFVASGNTDHALWTSDGTPQGTVLVKDLDSNLIDSIPHGLINFDGTLILLVIEPWLSSDLWRSDGTSTGTFRFGQFNTASSVSLFNGLPPNGPFILAADDGTHGRELWTMKDINAAPSFSAGPDITVSDESGPQPIAWASHVVAGPPDESKQTIQFAVQSDSNLGIFLTPPSIDANGNISFVPIPNISGTAEITVVLKDSGGTVGGGIDTSPPRTFSITVTKTHPLHNTARPSDVDNDGHVVAKDALAIINYINAFGARAVPADSQLGKPFGFLDVNGDGFLAPNDALQIINVINAGLGGEGEAQAAVAQDSRLDELNRLLVLLTMDGTRPSRGQVTGRASFD